jgi:transketolase
MSQAMDIRDAFFEELRAGALENPDLIVLTADMGAFSLDRFRREYPERVLNVGIAEQNMINLATGLALSGKRVLVYSIASFALQRCYEQIKVHVADPGLPVTVAGIGPGITYSSDGHSHHCVQDIANAAALPHFTVVSPGDPQGFRAAARLACTLPGPLYVRLDKGSFPDLPGRTGPGGVRQVLAGGQVLLVSTGIMAQQLPAMAAGLAGRGIQAGALLVETLKPLDREGLSGILAGYEAVVTLEEHLAFGGLGSAVSDLLVQTGRGQGLLRLALPECVVESLHGSREWMLAQAGLDVPSVIDRVASFLQARSAARVAATGARFTGAGGTDRQLDLAGFAELLGLPETAFAPRVREFIRTRDFRYRVLSGGDRERLLREILETIESGSLTRSGPHKQAVWEQGWSENLAEFLALGQDPGALLPKFVRPGAVKRLRGEFVVPADPAFESACVTVLREAVLGFHCRGAARILEFGCGTGHNLLALSEVFPGIPMVGLDWSPAACELVRRLAEARGLPLEARLFDMYQPDPAVVLTSSDAVFTIGALEQLGERFTPFLEYLLAGRPRVCVHAETMDELYDQDDLADYAARRYSRVRNYLRGFLAALRQLERAGRVEILQVQRTFGSQYHEGYSFVVWRPAAGGED